MIYDHNKQRAIFREANRLLDEYYYHFYNRKGTDKYDEIRIELWDAYKKENNNAELYVMNCNKTEE